MHYPYTNILPRTLTSCLLYPKMLPLVVGFELTPGPDPCYTSTSPPSRVSSPCSFRNHFLGYSEVHQALGLLSAVSATGFHPFLSESLFFLPFDSCPSLSPPPWTIHVPQICTHHFMVFSIFSVSFHRKNFYILTFLLLLFKQYQLMDLAVCFCFNFHSGRLVCCDMK